LQRILERKQFSTLNSLNYGGKKLPITPPNKKKKKQQICMVAVGLTIARFQDLSLKLARS